MNLRTWKTFSTSMIETLAEHKQVWIIIVKKTVCRQHTHSVEKTTFDMSHEFYFSFENRFILYKNYYVLKSYDGYIQEHNKNKKVNHYSILWSNRSIYKK